MRELEAQVAVDIGTLRLRAELSVAAGELVAVLGPNGAGKSTLLRSIAGLLPIDDGSVIVDGVTLDDPGSATFVPAERRPIGVVFQDYLLFPNMSAVENVAFGLRASGTARRQARDVAMDWLERVGLGDHADHRPSQLSGGQAQRVALARALAVDPAMLLLDEPLAALDARHSADGARRPAPPPHGLRRRHRTGHPRPSRRLRPRRPRRDPRVGGDHAAGFAGRCDGTPTVAVRRRTRRAQPRRRRAS